MRKDVQDAVMWREVPDAVQREREARTVHCWSGTAKGDVRRAASCGIRVSMRCQGLKFLAVPVLQRTAPLRSALRCARDPSLQAALRPGHDLI